jgi:hypothetical protein
MEMGPGAMSLLFLRLLMPVMSMTVIADVLVSFHRGSCGFTDRAGKYTHQKYRGFGGAEVQTLCGSCGFTDRATIFVEIKGPFQARPHGQLESVDRSQLKDALSR